MTFPSVVHLVIRNARRFRNSAAVVCADRVTSHAELAARVARRAGALDARGVRPGDRVALLAGNSDGYIETLLATLWLGAVACPLNVRWSPGDVAATVRHIEPAMTVVDRARLERFGTVLDPDQLVLLNETSSGGAGEPGTLGADGPSLPASERGGDDVALLLFTGGTTGFPKAAMLSHTNVLTAALAMRAVGCGSVGTYLHVAPLFHLAGVQLMVSHLMGGEGPQVVLPSFDPTQALATIERHRISNTLLVPTMLRVLLDHPHRARYDLSSLRRIHYGASPMPAALLADARAALGDLEFVQGYGMTETMLTTTLPPEAHHASGHRREVASSLGQPHPTIEIVVRDQWGQEVPDGTIGEFTVRGPTVMSGYYRDESATAAIIRDGWLHTGDAGYVDSEGYLYLVDRLKDIIVTGGENVASARVEDVLMSHPDVSAAAVVGLPDPRWGERVHALVVPTRGNAPTAEGLRAFCREHLAGFMVPRTIEFRDGLPVSAAGKVLKKALRDELRGAPPDFPVS